MPLLVDVSITGNPRGAREDPIALDTLQAIADMSRAISLIRKLHLACFNLGDQSEALECCLWDGIASSCITTLQLSHFVLYKPDSMIRAVTHSKLEEVTLSGTLAHSGMNSSAHLHKDSRA
jgi:hypothetical protein